MNAYRFWQESIEGLKPKMYVDDPQCGFYRKGVYERNEKGNNKRVGWTPVAIYMGIDSGVLGAQIGPSRDDGDRCTVTQDRDRINELWSYVAGNPISEEMWRAVAERGESWPDAHDPSKNKPQIEQVTMPPAGIAYSTEAPAAEESPEQKLIAEINQAKAGVSQYEKIESDDMAGRALSLKNEIVSLAGKLDKIREAKVRPHVDAQKSINEKYNPIIKDAKAQGPRLLQAIGKWEDTKREAQRMMEARQRLRDEEARLTASDAGPARAEPPITSNAPPPKAQVAAAVGRKASVKVAKFVTDIEIRHAFDQFWADPQVKELLMRLTQQSVDAGQSFVWATVEERSIVK